VSGTNGFAWAIAFFFGIYVVLSMARTLIAPKAP